MIIEQIKIDECKQGIMCGYVVEFTLKNFSIDHDCVIGAMTLSKQNLY